MDSEVGWLPSDPKYFSAVCRQISRHDRNTWNRLVSLFQDALFVESLQQEYPYPVVANLRCGAWYVRDPDATSYFKSTDGHHGNWSFSTARLNLHLLEIVAAANGVVIVDATRRGKRFPDALTKTIPIWIAVLNRALCLDVEPPCWYPELAASEIDAIECRLDGWVAALRELQIDLDGFRKTLQKPLKPYWIAQDDVERPRVTQGSYAVVLVSASANVSRTPRFPSPHAFEYVPGAADDEESWAHGLTPHTFWSEPHTLLWDGSTGLELRIEELLKRQRPADEDALHGLLVMPNGAASPSHAALNELNGILYCGVAPPPPALLKLKSGFLWLPVEESKAHKSSLTEALPVALDHVAGHLQSGRAVYICDTQPRGVCGALAVAARISYLLSEESEKPSGSCVSKLDVRRALAAVTQTGAQPTPSRALMKQVFNFFHRKGVPHRPAQVQLSSPRAAATSS